MYKAQGLAYNFFLKISKALVLHEKYNKFWSWLISAPNFCGFGSFKFWLGSFQTLLDFGLQVYLWGI
jgi:hypothetical protein